MVEQIFDRVLLRKNRQRFAKDFSDFNFLHIEVANKIIESLDFINRDFSSILEIGSRDGYLGQKIAANKNAKRLVQSEICQANFGKVLQNKVIADDEFLPFKNASFDLIVSSLNFHHINLVPQFLMQVKNLLKENGIFIAAFFGEENLSELVDIIVKTENEIYGGISPRTMPTIEVKTAANLLQKAGFKNPISDFEKIEVDYKEPLSLLKDLQKIAQNNILHQRSRKFFSKKFLQQFCQNYREKYEQDNKTIKATFEVVSVIGWK